MPGVTYLKREGKVFAVKQSAWSSAGSPAGADALRFTKVSFKENPERDPRTDQVDTRSEGETIEGRTTVEWSLEGFFMPSGALGVAPDIGVLLEAIFGTETVVGGTSVTYSFLRDLELSFFGLTLWHFGSHYGAGVRNAVVKECEFKGSGGDQSTFTMSGEATDMIRMGTGSLSANASGGATSIVLQTGEGAMYTPGARVDIGSETGFTVLTVLADTLTFSPALSGAQLSGVTVKPTIPTPIYAGSPVSKVRGLFNLGGGEIKIIDGSIKISDPLKIRNDEYGTAVASGFDSIGARSVTFSGQTRLLSGTFKDYGAFSNNVKTPLNFNIGDTATRRARFVMPAFEGMPGALESPEDETAMMSIEGPAKPTANENELALIFD